MEREALVVTHWFDSGESGEPYSATVRLTGRRARTSGKPSVKDTFTQEETVNGVIPGTGPVSLTSWVYGLDPGDWTVNAELVGNPSAEAARGRSRGRSRSLGRAGWSWRRWAISDVPATAVSTRWSMLAPLARSPAVLPGVFPALVTLAIVVGLITQAAILTMENVPVGASLAAIVLALVSGMVGAKLWYMALQRKPWRQTIGEGWSVDGFVVVAPLVAFAAGAILRLPIGTFLDAIVPGMFIGVAVGRLGCFFTGCCSGRCTRSHWGVWSSDRRVGARRVPTQLLESATGLVLAVAATLLILGDAPLAEGVVFVAALAAYLFVRQFLLRLRAESRTYSWRRSSTLVGRRTYG